MGPHGRRFLNQKLAIEMSCGARFHITSTSCLTLPRFKRWK
jgi:hypothetical protein